MAAIRQRNGRYQAQVRLRGTPAITKTFDTRDLASRWATQTELDIKGGVAAAPQTDAVTLNALINRYVTEITPHKKACEQEKWRLRRLKKDPISSYSLANLSSQCLRDFKARRIKDGNRTCHYDLTLIGHIIEVARKEWGYRIEFNPVRNVKKPTLNPPRTRRLGEQEFLKLESAVKHTDVEYLWPLVNLAIATAMRKSELLNLKWEDVSLDNRTIYIPDSKNGSPRTIPISSYAIEVLEGMHQRDGSKVFPTTSSAAFQSWRRLVIRAGIEGL
ncbi:MAG: site-specific integrase, partial [Alphaproteobacteria bacterium]